MTKDPSSTARLQLWTPVWLKEGSMSPLPLGCSCMARWGHPSAAVLWHNVYGNGSSSGMCRGQGPWCDEAVDSVMRSCTSMQSGMMFWHVYMRDTRFAEILTSSSMLLLRSCWHDRPFYWVILLPNKHLYPFFFMPSKLWGRLPSLHSSLCDHRSNDMTNLHFCHLGKFTTRRHVVTNPSGFETTAA